MNEDELDKIIEDKLYVSKKAVLKETSNRIDRKPFYKDDLLQSNIKENIAKYNKENGQLHNKENKSLYSKENGPLYSKENGLLYNKENGLLHSKENGLLHSKEQSYLIGPFYKAEDTVKIEENRDKPDLLGIYNEELIYDDVELKDVLETKKVLTEYKSDIGLIDKPNIPVDSQLAHIDEHSPLIRCEDSPLKRCEDSPLIQCENNEDLHKTQSSHKNDEKFKNLQKEFEILLKSHQETLHLKSKVYRFIYNEIYTMKKETNESLQKLRDENERLKKENEKLKRWNEMILEKVLEWRNEVKSRVLALLKKN